MTTTQRLTIDQPRTEVYINESGHITIEQECPQDENQFVVIHPLFVPTFIQWIKELAFLIQDDAE